MKLYIIRHGETQWNKEKRLQGRSNIQLNDYGRELAGITADALKNLNFDLIYSSPLDRAYETAQIIRGSRKVDIIKDERLIEISFGEYEGIPSNELGDKIDNFFFAPEKYVPGKGGERYEELCARTKDFLENIIYPLKDTQKSVLIVAHGALNKSLMLNLKGLEIKDIWKGEFQRNCCVNEYEITNNKIKVIEEAKIYYEGETSNFLENRINR